MDYFIWIVIVLISNCDPGELRTTANPRIIFTKLSSSNRPLDTDTQYTVLAYKPMCYHFQNMSVTRGWCFDYYNHDEILDQGELPPMILCQNVTHEMSALWKCNVTENNILERPTWPTWADFKQLNNERPKRTKYQTFYFNLHVKGAKSVKVTVNGEELMFSEADLSVPYDGDTIYFYEDGEHVQIVCRNPQSRGTVHLEYLTKDVTNASNSATFGMQLHSGSNNSYIECVYNATKPTDRYVYRVTFVTSKRLLNLNEIKTGNEDKAGEYSPLILGSSIGAVLVVLGITGVACWYARTRIKLIEAPYMTYNSESLTQQYAIERENQYDTCYDLTENVENIDPKDHLYTEIDYLTCKPKIEETQTRNSRVYDEPYVHITIG